MPNTRQYKILVVGSSGSLDQLYLKLGINDAILLENDLGLAENEFISHCVLNNGLSYQFQFEMKTQYIGDLSVDFHCHDAVFILDDGSNADVLISFCDKFISSCAKDQKEELKKRFYLVKTKDVVDDKLCQYFIGENEFNLVDPGFMEKLLKQLQKLSDVVPEPAQRRVSAHPGRLTRNLSMMPDELVRFFGVGNNRLNAPPNTPIDNGNNFHNH